MLSTETLPYGGGDADLTPSSAEGQQFICELPADFSYPASKEGFSVLMSVYHKEKSIYLRQSLESIFFQTLLPSEVILVCDGPLTPVLDAVIAEFTLRYSHILRVVRLPENRGLGEALNVGMTHCSFDIIARMDSDDYSLPTRFERQVGYMYRHPEIDLLNCAINEFSTNYRQVKACRRLPLAHEELLKYAKKRSPVNHPSVVFRKSAVEAAGGYRHFYLFEDYYLWVRMLMNGAHFHSLDEALLHFRMDNDTYVRRKGMRYNRSEIALQREFRRIGFISKWEFYRNILLRCTPRLFPKWLLKKVYSLILRDKPLIETR